MYKQDNLAVYQNTDVIVEVILRDASNTVLSSDVWTIWSDIKEEVDGQLIASFEITKTVKGFIMKLPHSVTKKIPVGLYRYDVLGKDETENVEMLGGGTFEVIGAITENKE